MTPYPCNGMCGTTHIALKGRHHSFRCLVHRLLATRYPDGIASWGDQQKMCKELGVSMPFMSKIWRDYRIRYRGKYGGIVGWPYEHEEPE